LDIGSLKTLQQEWAAVSAAPWSFAIVAGLFLGIGYGIAVLYYGGTISALRERLSLSEERQRGSTPTKTPESPPDKLLSQKETNDLIDAFRVISTNLDQKGKAATELSSQLEHNWSNWGKYQGMGMRTKQQEVDLASQLQKTLDDLHTVVFKDLLNDPSLTGLHQKIEAVLGSGAPLQHFRYSADTFVIGLSEIEKGNDGMIKIMSLNRGPLEENKLNFAAWITECNTRIDAARKSR
jgi:hypothetical protein